MLRLGALQYSYGCSWCPFAVICMYYDLVSICSVTQKTSELPKNGLKKSGILILDVDLHGYTTRLHRKALFMVHNSC